MTTRTLIMAVPWQEERAARARALQAQTGGEIVWDETRHAFKTWRKVLRTVGDGPAIILEDDVILAPRWREQVEAALEGHRDHVVQFFSMRKKDLTEGSRWEPGRTYSGTPCYYLPAGEARELLDYSKDWVRRHPEHPTGYDLTMADSMKARGVDYWLHVPSLVQHERWASAINPRRPRWRQSKTFRGTPG